MKTISSKDNSIYKDILRLTRKKYRDAEGAYILEGIKPLMDAISEDAGIERVFVADDMDNADAEDVLRRYFGDSLIRLDRKLFGTLSDTETSQGVISVVRKREYSLSDIAALTNDGKGNVLILDRLQDPGNTGTVIRTAEAAGYAAVIVMRGSADVYSPKVVRAASGSLFRVPVIQAETFDEVRRAVKAAGLVLTVTSPDAEIMYYDARLDRSTALVIGNEGNGVSGEFMKGADVTVGIPMKGSIESLNAAVAAGILMYRSVDINRTDER